MKRPLSWLRLPGICLLRTEPCDICLLPAASTPQSTISGIPRQEGSQGPGVLWPALGSPSHPRSRPFPGTSAIRECSPSPWLSAPQPGAVSPFLPPPPHSPGSASSPRLHQQQGGTGLSDSAQHSPASSRLAGVSAPGRQSPFPSEPCSPIRPLHKNGDTKQGGAQTPVHRTLLCAARPSLGAACFWPSLNLSTSGTSGWLLDPCGTQDMLSEPPWEEGRGRAGREGRGERENE